MNYKTRCAILCLIIIFFILLAPTIVFYSMGYSFDWQEKRIVLTGALYLKSTPKKAKVYINEKLKEETPAYIKRLSPKYYQIRVVKEGYQGWKKNLKIESQLVTEAKNILLIPNNPEIEIINDKIADDFSLNQYISQENKINENVFYIHKPTYIVYKTDQVNSFQEQINLTPLPEDNEYQIIVSGNENLAVLNNQGSFYLLNKQKRNFELIKENVKGAIFSYDNKKILYYTSNEIWIYYLEDNNKKKATEYELITRMSQEIGQVIWHKESNHIIFLIDQQLKIVELDDRDERNMNDIIKINVQEIGYSFKNDLIYLIKDNKLIGLSLE